MIDVEHAKRVLAHQEDIEISEYRQLLLEIAERLIAIENRLSRFETRTRERIEDFLRGAQNLTIRFDRLETQINKDTTCSSQAQAIPNTSNLKRSMDEK